ncbi:MAG: S-layer homology domain-containing protein [Firmicutes bacterium]|nr:S-layer homology domain-containing protein [Bacillota bacterium]
MKKTLVLCLMGLLLLPVVAWADDLSQGDLVNLLPDKEANQKLTRAEYAVMLSQAAGLPESEVDLPTDVPDDAWYVNGIKSLVGNDIMAGYKDGTIKPEKNISRVEVVVMLSRVLGLPGIMADDVQIKGLENHAWAAGPYSWCVKEGFLSAEKSPSGIITAEEADKLLIGAFATDELGKEINTKVEEAMLDIKTMSLNGSMHMDMELTTEAAKEIPKEISSMGIDAEIESKINIDQGLHQVMSIKLPKTTDVTLPEMKIEQYYTPKGMFMKMTDPSTGGSQWIKYPDGILPKYEVMMNQQVNSLVTKEMSQYLHYRVLDDIKVNDEEYYQLAFYGQINDFNKLMALMNQNMPNAINQNDMIQQTKGLIKSMSFMGTMTVTKDDYLPVSVDTKAIATFNSQFAGETLPFTSIKYNYKVNYDKFNADVNIELPQEALESKDLPIN